MGNRLLPQSRYNDIYLVHKFFTWTNELIPNKFKDLTNDHPRMVIPFRDADGRTGGGEKSSPPSFCVHTEPLFWKLLTIVLQHLRVWVHQSCVGSFVSFAYSSCFHFPASRHARLPPVAGGLRLRATIPDFTPYSSR